MKIFVVMKVKDMKVKKKTWVVDKAYTNYDDAMKREDRLHCWKNKSDYHWRAMCTATTPVLRTERSETYIIKSTLRGKI